MKNIQFLRNFTKNLKGGYELGNCAYYDLGNGNRAKFYCTQDAVVGYIIDCHAGQVDTAEFPFANYFKPVSIGDGPEWTQYIDGGKWYFSQYESVLPTEEDFKNVSDAMERYMNLFSDADKKADDMEGGLYKTFLYLRKDGDVVGDAILVEDFESEQDAITAGIHRGQMFDGSWFEVRLYAKDRNNIIGGGQDTGKVVYSSRKEVAGQVPVILSKKQYELLDEALKDLERNYNELDDNAIDWDLREYYEEIIDDIHDLQRKFEKAQKLGDVLSQLEGKE